MKARQYINMVGMAAAVLLSSCVKDTLYDTPHPDYGKIAVTADWSARGEGIDIPATWTVTMGDYTGTETSATHAPDHLFAPGSYTLAVWSDKDHRYALWEVAPEVRYYMGEKKAWYLGALFKAGQFNYKLSETGKQGDLMGGGITAGHQLRLNKALALDFNLGLGYLNADFEKYEVIDGVRVRRGNETKDWFGPINAGVTLVWKLF